MLKLYNETTSLKNNKMCMHINRNIEEKLIVIFKNFCIFQFPSIIEWIITNNKIYIKKEILIIKFDYLN